MNKYGEVYFIKMKIHSLEISNYRNYEKAQIDFSDGINILYGDNAQGKTNLLEAIYLCCTTKSQRGSKDNEIIKFNENESHISLNLEKNFVNHQIDMHLYKNKRKSIIYDSIQITKTTQIYGNVNIISFCPDDLSIIKNGPDKRRRFIDMELCQLDKIYLFDLINYNKSLNQRNILLKQIEKKQDYKDILTVWDEQLVNYGKKIIESRTKYIKELNLIANKIHKFLSNNTEELEIKYQPNIEIEGFYEKLVNSINKDIIIGSTNTGPHRDDILLLINEKDVRKFGSQGQQRSAALSLKLAEIEFVKNKINDTPILLLDDVLSELDRNRQTQLLDNIKGIQTIITCTGLEEFVNHRINYDKVYRVEKGHIFYENSKEINI